MASLAGTIRQTQDGVLRLVDDPRHLAGYPDDAWHGRSLPARPVGHDARKACLQCASALAASEVRSAERSLIWLDRLPSEQADAACALLPSILRPGPVLGPTDQMPTKITPVKFGYPGDR
jgi:hypothetical protein